MSLVWMIVVAAAILVEKALPGGETFARVLAVVLIVAGVWVGSSPGSVPGPKEPSPMQPEMQMG
jgi:hypothetical protein